MIRKFYPADTDALINVWLQASAQAHPFLSRQFVKKIEADMKGLYIPNSESWVYEEEGTIIGFISMMGNEIGALFVMPEEQGRGIGSLLVGFVALMHNELRVEVFEKNRIGRAFYRKYGFCPIGQYTHHDSGQEVLRLGITKQQDQLLSIHI